MDSKLPNKDVATESREQVAETKEKRPVFEQQENPDIDYRPYDNGTVKGVIVNVQTGVRSCHQKFFDEKVHSDPMAAAKAWAKELLS